MRLLKDLLEQRGGGWKAQEETPEPEKEDLQRLSLQQLINLYVRQKKLRLASPSTATLEILIDGLTGGDLEEFFDENPGAVKAVIDWIRHQTSDPGWEELLITHLGNPPYPHP